MMWSPAGTAWKGLTWISEGWRVEPGPRVSMLSSICSRQLGCQACWARPLCQTWLCMGVLGRQVDHCCKPSRAC